MSVSAKQTGVVDKYLGEQTPKNRELLERLRAIAERTVPDAEPAIKWGVPVYQRKGRNAFALASFKDHVAINFFAPPEKLADPKRKLEGAGKTSRMLKVRSAADIDAASIAKWLKAAADG